MDALILKEINLQDCILYPEEILDKKLHWLRTEFPMYSNIKASLAEVGMINPIWVFELINDKYRVVKGCLRCVAWLDLGHKAVKALVAPLGMKRSVANRLFYDSTFVEDIPVIDPETKKILMENGKPKHFLKGF